MVATCTASKTPRMFELSFLRQVCRVGEQRERNVHSDKLVGNRESGIGNAIKGSEPLNAQFQGL